MNSAVEGYLRRLRLGRHVTSGHLTVIPLLSPDECSAAYVGLGTALKAGTLSVEEVTSAGVVGTLMVHNTGSLPVLLLDGEELAGARQNRVLNTTVLVGEHADTEIPVTCTEQGRWAYNTERFSESEAHAPPRIRRLNTEAVARSLARRGVAEGDQLAVWQEIERLSADAGVRSATSAMRDVFESRRPQLDNSIRPIPCEQDQIGMLAFASRSVLGFDIVSRPEVYARLHRKLLGSYAMDAMLAHGPAAPAFAYETARGFVNGALKTTELCFTAAGCGDSLRYTGSRITGSALTWNGRLVHAAFFRLPPGEEACGELPLPGARTRMAFPRRQGEAGGTIRD